VAPSVWGDETHTLKKGRGGAREKAKPRASTRRGNQTLLLARVVSLVRRPSKGGKGKSEKRVRGEACTLKGRLRNLDCSTQREK